MKLRDLQVLVIGTPPPGWGGHYWLIVKVTTDTGITGWGEVYAASVGPRAMVAVIEDVFARHMLGENPEDIEKMFRRAYSSGFTQRPDLTVMGAFSGLEIYRHGHWEAFQHKDAYTADTHPLSTDPIAEQVANISLPDLRS